MSERFVLPNQRVGDNNNKPLDGAQLYFFENGTSTPQDTFSDSALTTANANPVVADSQGQFGNIFLSPITYTVRLDDKNDVTQPGYPRNDVNDTGAVGEWTVFSGTPTFVDTTNFSVVGDQTALFQVNRRVRATVTAGTVYGFITVSSFSAGVTTVTVVLDSGNLDSGISATAYGVLSATNPALPKIVYTIQDGTARSSATSVGQVQDSSTVYITDTGVVDAYEFDFVPAYTAYVTGMRFAAKITNTNTITAPTGDVNGVGVKTIKKFNGTALVAGDLEVDQIAEFVYDGTDLILQNPLFAPQVHDHSDTANGSPIARDGIALTFTAGTNLHTQHTATETSVATAYERVKGAQVPGSGTLRIVFSIKSIDGVSVRGRIYRNGVAVGTERITSSTTPVQVSEDIAGWSANDLVQIYAHMTGGATGVEISEFFITVAETNTTMNIIFSQDNTIG